MPIISIRYSDLDYGKLVYIINDEFQEPHVLVGVETRAGKQTKFVIADANGKEVSLWDFQCSFEVNKEMLNRHDKDEDDDD